MPVNGLPFAVEGALNNLMINGHVTSWRIHGHGTTATLILKFSENGQGVMADQPNSIHYKKKPPSQVKRDQIRSDTYHSEKQETKQTKKDSTQQKEKIEVEDKQPTDKKQEEEEKKRKLQADDSLQQKEFSVQEESRPTIVTEHPASVTQKEDSSTQENTSHQTKQHSNEKSFTETIFLDEAERRIKDRNFSVEQMRSQVANFSMRMKRLHVNPERNCRLDFIKSGINKETGKEELIAETDDFLLRCEVNDTTQKLFLIKNCPMYRTDEEMRQLTIISTTPPVNRELYQRQIDEMKMDLLVMKNFLKIYSGIFIFDY